MNNVSLVCVGLFLVSSVTAFAVDDRGNTATQGPATWRRAAQYMVPKPQFVRGHLTLVPPVKVEVSHLMDPAAPQSPFATQWSLTPALALRRDTLVSVEYSEELNFTTSSATYQRTNRHGILGQKPSDFQRFL